MQIQVVTEVLLFALSTFFMLAFEFVDQTISISFIGHYATKTELAGIGLGNMLANAFFNIGIISLNGALDTLISQGFGAGKP